MELAILTDRGTLTFFRREFDCNLFRGLDLTRRPCRSAPNAAQLQRPARSQAQSMPCRSAPTAAQLQSSKAVRYLQEVRHRAHPCGPWRRNAHSRPAGRVAQVRGSTGRGPLARLLSRLLLSFVLYDNGGVMARSSSARLPRVRRQPLPGDVRCDCGALLFKALGPAVIELKCRRCGRVWQFVP